MISRISTATLSFIGEQLLIDRWSWVVPAPGTSNC